MSGRMSRYSDRLEAKPASQLHKLGGVGELLVRLLLGKRIAAEREQVLESGGAEAADDLAELEARVRHARQMGHRREIGRSQKVDDNTRGSLARDAPAAVGDRDERRSERL